MRLATALVLIATAPALCQDDALVLRAFEQPPTGQAMGVGPQGVRVRSPQGDVVVVGWDRVLAVPAALREAADPFQGLAVDTWRARTRMERGDLILAAPLLQAVFEAAQAEGRQLRGPTGLVVAEGLLRCRLARGAGAAAIEPRLAWLDAAIVRQPRTTFANRAWATDVGLPAAIDPSSELSPQLPPIWLASPSLTLVLQLEATEGERDKATAMRVLYQAAARHELGQRVDTLPDVPREASVELVRDIVAARVLDDDARAGARARLESALTSASTPWMEAWILAAIGRSLVLEAAEEDRLRGVAQLLRVHVLHRAGSPHLADICVAEAAATLHALGQRDAASALVKELSSEQAAPGLRSQVLSWPGLAELLDGSLPDTPAPGQRDDSATDGGSP
ncbi:MAG: hypothetical protein ACFCBV_11765 [Phycisphaerales bacterium]